MKILVTHVYSRHNNGDLAILSVMLDQLKKIFPKAEITILVTDNVSEYAQSKNIRVINSLFHYCIYQTQNFFVRCFRTLYVLGSTFIWASLYKFLKINMYELTAQRLRLTCKAYFEADLILPVGGGYLNGGTSLRSYITLFIQLHSLIISKLLGKHTILCSQSIGPFSNIFQKFIVGKVLNTVDGILVRENFTAQTLNEIGVKNSLVHKTIDLAFLFKTNNKINMRDKFGISKKKKIVGITVRKWLPTDQQNRFETEIVAFTKYLVEQKGALVVFIPQVTSSLRNDDDDMKVHRRIEKILGEKTSVVYLNKRYDHFEVKSIYESLDYLIGTRMHSVIFSLTGYVPCIAIEYQYKTSGIMRELGLSKYVIKIEDVSSNKLINLFGDLERNKIGYVKKLTTSLPQYMKKIDKSYELLRAYRHK